MKNAINQLKGVAIIVMVAFLNLYPPSTQAQVGVSVSYQTFYDDLSPYGQWVSDGGYGNVWVPYTNDANFRPYCTGGHWAMTDYGNTWVSDYPWGWATFHYGRWTYDQYYGWVWVPGSDWAPAWVSWRYGRGNCGWAPLGPNVSVGVAIGGGWHCPDNWWVFVGPQYLYRPNPYSYWRGPSYNNTYIRQTTIINNTYIDNSTHVTYSYGPRANQIEAVTHQRVQVYKVAAVNRPGSTNINRNEVNIYRPAVNRSTISSAHPANVVRAPRPISRQLQGPTGRTPAFHQVMERQNPAMVKAASTALRNPRSPQVQPEVLKSQVITSRPQPAAQRPAPNANRPQPVNNARPNQQNISRPSPANRPQPQSQSQHMQQSRPQPQPQHMQQSRPQPQPQHMQQSRPQPQPQHMQQPRPQPQNFNRPQSQPQHMQQPRPQPQNFNRPQSQPQHIQQPRPMPQQAPHMQAPPRPEGHPGGGGGHPEGGGRPNGRG